MPLQYLDDIAPFTGARTTVAIGVFDGVHRGHQEILRQAVAAAKPINAVPIALTFDIHPEELVAPGRAPGYVCSLEQRAELICSTVPGIETVIVIRFTPEFASQSAENFTTQVLSGKLNAAQVLVGEDFRYGHARSGDRHTLKRDGERLGFDVTIVHPVQEDGVRISSTRVRDLIALGEVEAAARLLGHDVAIRGVVVTGKQLGRTIGFPTANLRPDQVKQVVPANGVYAAFAELPDGRMEPAAVSVGTNPTTDTDGLRKVEAFLLNDFHEDLYDTQLTLHFVHRLRDEHRFDDLDALIIQMNADVTLAKSLLL